MNINTVNIYSKSGNHDIRVTVVTLNKHSTPAHEIICFSGHTIRVERQ